MDDDQAGWEDGATIQNVEDEDPTVIDVEYGPERGSEENIENEGAIDQEAEGTEENQNWNIEDGF